MYLWIRLRAEKREQTYSVPSSEVVLLSIGHAQNLVLHHLPVDHYRSSEPQGLTQSAIYRMERTAEWMMSERCQRKLNQRCPVI